MTDPTIPSPKSAVPPSKPKHPGPWLLIEQWNGETTFAVCYFPDPTHEEKRRGGRRIEISPEDAAVGIKILECLYGEQAVTSKQATPDFLKRLVAIVKGSDFEGERLNAASLYQKITGKPCPGFDPSKGRQ